MLYCSLRSACAVYALCFVLPYELDVVWLFFAFILVELREQVDCCLLDYHLSLFCTEMSVFSCGSCQCVAKYGFWNVRCAEDLNIFTDYLCIRIGM